MRGATLAPVGAEAGEVDVEPVWRRLPHHRRRRRAGNGCRLQCPLPGSRGRRRAHSHGGRGASSRSAGALTSETVKRLGASRRSIALLDVRRWPLGIAARERQCSNGVGSEGAAGRIAPQPAVDIGGLQRGPGPDRGPLDLEQCSRMRKPPAARPRAQPLSRIRRAFCRFQSRLAASARLSCSFLPWARASRSLARPRGLK